jgi:ABC-type multidrug transport system fused ATPase/permease subunit
MIAHGLSTIRNADYIYLIKEGRVVESGEWNDLVSIDKGYFKSLFDSQHMK